MSFLFSLLIGLERQMRGRAIGLRTSVLVSIGSFLFVSFSFLTTANDISRMAAQVVSGIGFLGAGVILKDGTNIRGLNTAATLWCDAAIGILCAGGFLIEALIGTILILFSNIVLRFVALKLTKNKVKTNLYEFNILCKKESSYYIKNLVNKLVNREEITLTNMSSNEQDDSVSILVSILFDSNNNYYVDKLVAKLTTEPSVLSLNINRLEAKKHVELDDDE